MMQGWYYVKNLTGQRHDRVQTESQQLQPWTAVSTLLGVASYEIFSLSTDIHIHKKAVKNTCMEEKVIIWLMFNLNINQIITFSSMQVFLLLFCVYGDYWNSKQKAKQYTENLSAKLQNSYQNSTFSWVSCNLTLNNPVQELYF